MGSESEALEFASSEIGWILNFDGSSQSYGSDERIPDSESLQLLDELRYLKQTFGALAAAEQIRYWNREGSLLGLKLSGGRSLESSVLLMGMDLGDDLNREFALALKSHLIITSKGFTEGSAHRAYLLQRVMDVLGSDDQLSSMFEAETEALQFRMDAAELWSKQPFEYHIVSDWIYFFGEDSGGNRWVWFSKLDTFKTRLLQVAESTWNDSTSRLEIVEAGLRVDTADRLTIVVDLRQPLDNWRLLCRVDESSLVSPTRERTVYYLWVGFITTLASVIFAFIGMGMIKRQISLAKLKNDLAATVSHELKTPIASVRILVDTLLQNGVASDVTKTREYLELISKENQRLGLLVEKFLTFSKMERGNQFLETEPMDANLLISEAVKIFHERFPGIDYSLTVGSSIDDAEIQIDPQAMLAVLGNLLENAYKYSQTPREMEIGAETVGESVHLIVKDNGEGISPVEQKRIFRQFYQPDRRLNRHKGGVGLGLSIVAYIVKQHRGKIELVSNLGEGSLFRIILPHAKDTNH